MKFINIIKEFMNLKTFNYIFLSSEIFSLSLLGFPVWEVPCFILSLTLWCLVTWILSLWKGSLDEDDEELLVPVVQESHDSPNHNSHFLKEQCVFLSWRNTWLKSSAQKKVFQLQKWKRGYFPVRVFPPFRPLEGYQRWSFGKHILLLSLIREVEVRPQPNSFIQGPLLDRSPQPPSGLYLHGCWTKHS